ncbi:MAG: IS200/IS605 family transposase [Phycisphaerales bacterium]
MPSSWTQNYYHLVFGTKHRERVITPELHERLYPFMGGILREHRAQLIAGNGMPEHVHLFIRFPADLARAVMAREVKSRSSGWIHETFPGMGAFAWQRGYGGFTVSRSLSDDVERYVREQRRHHESMSFEEEFLGLLRKHEVEFDERYVFD